MAAKKGDGITLAETQRGSRLDLIAIALTLAWAVTPALFISPWGEVKSEAAGEGERIPGSSAPPIESRLALRGNDGLRMNISFPRFISPAVILVVL
jgi:hypothetical protein